MEFQFGTNWSHFSRFAGGVIGQTLAMEGMFAFFLESAFLGLFLYGEKRLSRESALVVGGRSVSGFVAFGIFHYRHRCLDAESGGIRHGPGWFRAAQQLLGTCAQPMGLVAICAQHERRGDHGRFRDGVGRRFLFAVGETRRAWTHLCSGGRDGRCDCHAFCSCFRRAMGRAECWPTHQPTTLAAMEALIRKCSERSAGADRPARCSAAQDRQSAVAAGDAELSDLSPVGGRSARPKCVSAGPVAGQHPAALLRRTTSWWVWERSSSRSW